MRELNSKIKPDISLFVDFRSFLRAWVEAKKNAFPHWSFKVWAKQLKLKSPSTLIMIVNGQRFPSEKLARRLCDYFVFSDKQRAYFLDLVRLEKVKNDVRLSIEIMQDLNNRYADKGFHFLDPASFRTIANWHYYAIRELVNVDGFKESPQWIRKQLNFKVHANEITKAIDTLLQLGLLKRSAKGRLGYGNGHVDTSKDIADEGLKQFHGESLVNAQKALQTFPPHSREISGGVFAMRKTQLPRAKELIRKFQVEMCQLLEEKSSDAVYQLEVAFFPLADLKNLHKGKSNVLQN